MLEPVDAPLYFAADVHWRPAPAPKAGTDPLERHVTGAFGRFLGALADRARRGARPRLYVLGDLFDFWFEHRGRTFAFYEPHLAALRSAVTAGLQVDVLFGNRDFLYRHALQRETGVQVLGDRAEVMVGGRRLLLHHGDLFCAADRRYQIYRRIVRSRPLRALARLVPLGAVLPVISRMQRVSQAEIHRKTERSMAVVDSAVAHEHAQGFQVVICGHVHRPAVKCVTGARHGQRLVILGPWDAQGGCYGAWDGRNVVLHAFALSPNPASDTHL